MLGSFLSLTDGVHSMGQPIHDEREFVLDAPANKASLKERKTFAEANAQLEKIVKKYDYDYERVRAVVLKDNPSARETTSIVNYRPDLSSKNIFLIRGSLVEEYYSASFRISVEGKIVEYNFYSNYIGL